MTDAEFLTAFEKATLPRTLWTHEAHVRMAYLYLWECPDATLALPGVRQRICHYNQANGNRTGYHETITVAFLTLVADRLRQNAAQARDWETFRDAHPDLITDGLGVLLRHYTRDRLLSAEARVAFIAPDVCPLP
jgi:hypothetical protein